MKKYGLSKHERVKLRKEVKELFSSKAQELKLYPIKVLFIIKKEDNNSNNINNYPAKILVSVSHKRIKRATQRNLIKRHIKEAFRLNKSILYEPLSDYPQLTILIAFVYVSKTPIPYQEIETQVKTALSIIVSKVSSTLK